MDLFTDLTTETIPAYQCDHRALRYPNPMQQNIKRCPKCDTMTTRAKWLGFFSEEEIEDLQGYLELLAIRAQMALPVEDPDHLTYRQGFERSKALIDVHEFAGRDLSALMTKVQRISEGHNA